jgi:hypothetical protein
MTFLSYFASAEAVSRSSATTAPLDELTLSRTQSEGREDDAHPVVARNPVCHPERTTARARGARPPRRSVIGQPGLVNRVV